MAAPSVCVLLPVLDESDAIDACLSSLRAQDYPGALEVIVAEGGSTDGTRDQLATWVDGWAAISIVDNPDRVQSRGLWLAANRTDAEVLVRADAHTTYAPDYVSRSVALLTAHDAIAVGGPMRPVATDGFARSVVTAMTHPLGIGPAAFHRDDRAGPVDTVYLGAFRREDFLAAGGMRTLPSRVAEDADLYHRWRRAGQTIWLDPSIRSEYRPRETPSSLWRQFHRYGLGKADMLLLSGQFPSRRPLAPLALVAALAAGGVLLPWTPVPLGAVLVVWLGVLGVAFRFRPGPWLAAAIMHLSYGLGLWRGFLRRPSSVRAAVIENVPRDRS